MKLQLMNVPCYLVPLQPALCRHIGVSAQELNENTLQSDFVVSKPILRTIPRTLRLFDDPYAAVGAGGGALV